MVNTKITPRKSGLKCPLCKKRFEDEKAWQEHIIMCGKEKRQKKFECCYEGCEYDTNKKFDFERHQATVHKDDSSWEAQDPGELIGEVSEDSDSEMCRVHKPEAQKESVCEKDTSNVPEVNKKLEDEGVNTMNNTTLVGPPAKQISTASSEPTKRKLTSPNPVYTPKRRNPISLNRTKPFVLSKPAVRNISCGPDSSIISTPSSTQTQVKTYASTAVQTDNVSKRKRTIITKYKEGGKTIKIIEEEENNDF